MARTFWQGIAWPGGLGPEPALVLGHRLIANAVLHTSSWKRQSRETATSAMRRS